MKEIIKISETNGRKVVSAKDLHNFLSVKSKFQDWMKNRIKKYGFIENQDYVTVSKNLENGGREIDYALSIDTAKEIAMVQGNEKGKEARQYFIECEKQLKYKIESDYPLLQHTKRETQISNSKHVNAYLWNAGGVEDVTEYNRKSCLLHSGYTPSQLKEIAKKEGLKSSQRTSGKEVLRHMRPEIAASMSMTDALVKHGAKLEEIAPLSVQAQPIIAKLQELKRLSA